MLLRILIASGPMTKAAAAAALAKIQSDVPAASGGRVLGLKRVVDDLNVGLENVEMKVAWARGEGSGGAYLVFANTKADELAKEVFKAADREARVTALRAVVNCLVDSECVVGNVSVARAAGTHPHPPAPLRSGALLASHLTGSSKLSLFARQAEFLKADVGAGAGAGAASGGGCAAGKIKPITKKRQWEQAINVLIDGGWITTAAVSIDGQDERRVFLGPRAVAELQGSLAAKGVADCARCHVPCVSPDPEQLPDKRLHFACALLSAEKFDDGGSDAGGSAGGAGGGAGAGAGGGGGGAGAGAGGGGGAGGKKRKLK